MLPTGPDIAQFKQGVKTVAGKMAVLANGVMNTIQVTGPETPQHNTITHTEKLYRTRDTSTQYIYTYRETLLSCLVGHTTEKGN